MSIPAGTRLGRYEIRAKIGEGGMGEVYRASDARLARDVAIKVLPAAFSADPERMSRFEQEAQAAGALNHPNILAIYDVSSHDGAPYVVSELLEGETLRERLGQGALLPRRAAEYGLQVAYGLAAAHEKGIVHRDLKPENIFITRDERVKILDFGLAKLLEPAIDGAAGATAAATRQVHTNPGSVMGTVGYMSPEQVRGQPVDHRTDIFSFGAVLYEMLSGNRAFGGESAADSVSAVLKDEPPELTGATTLIPPGLERVIRRCLDKNRERRFQSASDLAFALETLAGLSGSGAQAIVNAESPVGERQGRKSFERLGWISAGLCLILALAAGGLYLRQDAPAAETMRFSIPAPEQSEHVSFALSPDGRSIAMAVAGGGGVSSLWLRTLDSTVPRKLTGTDGAMFPFWSPDSRSIGFFAGRSLKRIDVAGGAAQELAQLDAEGRGGAWAPDGTILFAPGYTSALLKVPAAGGTAPTPATALDASRQQTSHRWPWFLPDGRHFLYFSRATRKDAEGIYVGSLDSDDRQFLLQSARLAAFAPGAPGAGTGYLLFLRDSTLTAQPFDPHALKLTGEPFTIIDGVLNYPGENGPTAFAAFSPSTNGHLTYLLGREALTQLGWYDRNGNQVKSLTTPAAYREPSLSPDGKRLIFSIGQESENDIWLLDTTRSTMTRLTFDPAAEACPLWSSDGSHIFFSSARNGHQQLYRKLSTGAGGDELLLATEFNAFADDSIVTSKGESFLLYELEHESTRFDIYLLPLFGDRKPIPFLNTGFNETHAQFSPDGRWVAYSSDESGRSEVYVQSFPATGGKWQISASGGDQAHWRADGRELFYLTPDKKLVAVPIAAGASFEPGVPVTLFTTQVPTTSLTDDRNNYLASADGQRFLFNYLHDSGTGDPITLILNWAPSAKR